MLKKSVLVAITIALLGAASASAVTTDTIIVATAVNDRGNVIKLDGQSLEAFGSYRSDYWPRIASLLPLPNGNFAVIPFKDGRAGPKSRAP